MELLDKPLIKSFLSEAALAALDEMLIFDRLTSTNDYLLDLAKTTPEKTLVCLAEQQTKGRGQHGRTWVSPFACGCYLSLLWHFDNKPSEIIGLSLAIGVAVVNALKQFPIEEGVSLKWPNDVLFQGRKLAGILIEMLPEKKNRCSVVIGVGMNIHNTSTVTGPALMNPTVRKFCGNQEINQPWVTLAEISQVPPERNRLIAQLINEIIAVLRQFPIKKLPHFVAEWKKYDGMIGKPVSITTVKNQLQGIMEDVSPTGELLIKMADNTTQRFMHGEVSLRSAASSPVTQR